MDALSIHQSATISKSVIFVEDKENTISIGKNTHIGDHVKIYPGVIIGDNCYIGDHNIIGHPIKTMLEQDDVREYIPRSKSQLISASHSIIGSGSVIRSHSIIYSHVEIGPSFRSGHHILIREHTSINEGVVFESYASCDGYTIIGEQTHIGQYVMLAHGAEIGGDCFIGGIRCSRPISI